VISSLQFYDNNFAFILFKYLFIYLNKLMLQQGEHQTDRARNAFKDSQLKGGTVAYTESAHLRVERLEQSSVIY
jgi:hypothetical protein